MTSNNLTADIGLRERKKLDTRRTIRQVALDLATENGLEALTVEAIAHGAGISPRTFFNYFSHKEDALVTDAAAAAAALHPQIVARPAEESPLHAIRAVIAENDIFSLMNTDRDRTLARQKLVHQHPTLVARQLHQQVLMEQSVSDAVALRLGVDASTDMRPSLVAGVAGTALRLTVLRWAASDEEKLSDMLLRAFDMLEQGLLACAPSSASASVSPAEEGGCDR
ncbi:TetR/AcrR family transcriptional regulator [Brevibacterium yomogidense]|uniref:TetR/AcrR family transcriptional regulator n=1 Tax=Brevibacterium yomogidense TaxID=946573 RepID=UPI0018E03CE8|nr:TetR family transcriptional regulator [Brevibacterium yomogidense]